MYLYIADFDPFFTNFAPGARNLLWTYLLTYFNGFGVRVPLGGLLLLDARVALQGKTFGGNLGAGEHMPKSPFWKPPFCEPLSFPGT